MQTALIRLPVHTSELYAAFSPDRSCLLTGGDGPAPKVQIWDVATGASLQELNGHTHPIAAVAWTSDQQRVASGAFDGDVRVWDAASGERLHLLTGHGGYVRSLEFNASGDRLLCGAGDGLVWLWDLTSAKAVRQFTGHTDGVYHAMFDVRESRIVSGGRDGTIRVWDVNSGRCLRVIEDGGVQHMAWHPDQRRLLSCARDIRLWDAESGARLLVFAGHEDTIRSVAWSRDGQRVLSASHDGTIRIWDAETARCLDVLRGGGFMVNAVWTADETAILACDAEGGLFRGIDIRS